MAIVDTDAALAPIRTAVRAVAGRLKDDRLSLAQAHQARAQAAGLMRLVAALDGDLGEAHRLQHHAGAIADAIDGRDSRKAHAACTVFEQALEAAVSGAVAAEAEPATIAAPADETSIGNDPVRDHGSNPSSVARLGELVRAARKTGNLSQGELASRASVGRRFVVELEGGKGTLEIGRVLAVCDAAGLVVTVSAATARQALAVLSN